MVYLHVKLYFFLVFDITDIIRYQLLPKGMAICLSLGGVFAGVVYVDSLLRKKYNRYQRHALGKIEEAENKYVKNRSDWRTGF